MIFARLLGIAIALAPAAGWAQLSLEAVVAKYAGAQSYCDSGKWGMKHTPSQPGFTEEVFTRCASRDGRFKHVQYADRPRKDTHWSDGRKYFRHSDYGDVYQEYSLDNDTYLFGLYRDRSQVFPVFVFRMFVPDARTVSNADGRARYFSQFKPSGTLSTPEITVFENGNDFVGDRIHVRVKDQVILRQETLQGGQVVRFVTLDKAELDRPLAEADLSHRPPLLVRFSMANSPVVFVAGLLVATVLAGAAFWGVLFSRAADAETVRDLRGRLWRWNIGAFVIVAVGLGILAVLSYVNPGKGHPPAIVLVWIMGIWAALGFAVTTLFLLASYLVQGLSRRKLE